MHVQETAATTTTPGDKTGDILSGLMQNEMGGVGEGVATHEQNAKPMNATDASETHSPAQLVPATEPVIDLGASAIKATKAAVKSFASIQGYDKDAEEQRLKVRALMAKQSACLEAKLHGQKAADGEDFESVAKKLRKENNKLDAMLEGKEGMYGKVRLAIENAIGELKKMADELKKLEEEG